MAHSAHTSQLHRRFSREQVVVILEKYRDGNVSALDAQRYLNLKKSQFFVLVKKYRTQGKKDFSITYPRHTANHVISPKVRTRIVSELVKQKQLIVRKDVPLDRYNYAFVKDTLQRTHHISVSASTVGEIAHDLGYVVGKKQIPNDHTRVVTSACVGELLQHDTSIHLFAPDAKEKWYLITTLDDCSRDFLYGKLFLHETSWAHISAMESVCTRYGIPLAYYSDSHSIFRYVRARDVLRPHHSFHTFTDDVLTQWKAVTQELGIKALYATSPQAKGKIERPYRWLQDHLVRRFVNERVTNIDVANTILADELRAYNQTRIHSITEEIPHIRLNTRIHEGKSLFRPLTTPPHLASVADVFSLRFYRQTDGYRKITINNLKFQIQGAHTYAPTEIRMRPSKKEGVLAIAYFQDGHLLSRENIKMGSLAGVQF